MIYRFGVKAFKSERYVVFDQTFFEKVCGQAFFEKGYDHADSRVFDQTQPLRRLTTPSSGVFDQTFFEKVCGQAFSQWFAFLIKLFLKKFVSKLFLKRVVITPAS